MWVFCVEFVGVGIWGVSGVCRGVYIVYLWGWREGDYVCGGGG